MAFQPVTDAGNAVVRGAFSNGVVLDTVLSFALTGTLDQAYADAVTQDISDAYDEISTFLTDDLTLADVLVTDLRTDGAPQFTSVAGNFPITGTETVGGPLPLQVAALVSWKTSLRGKSYRGRSYLGGFTEDFSNGRDIDTALRDAIAAWADSLLGASAQFGVISRFHGGTAAVPVPRASGVFTSFTGRTVHGTWHTQRRRARV